MCGHTGSPVQASLSMAPECAQIFAVTLGGTLVALDSTDGSTAFTYNADEPLTQPPAMDSAGTIFLPVGADVHALSE